jgi:hypothetical protein
MNEKLFGFEYTPIPHHLGMAAVRLIFQPSEELAQLVQGYMKPEQRARTPVLFKSDEVTRLQYTSGDADGLQYQHLKGAKDDVSDQEWINNYKHTIDTILSQNIPVAAYHPRLEDIPKLGLSIELTLLPDENVKRKIGATLLRYVGGGATIIHARTIIPPSKLVDEEAQFAAQYAFVKELGIDETYNDIRQGMQASPESRRLFVKTAFVNSRPIL